MTDKPDLRLVRAAAEEVPFPEAHDDGDAADDRGGADQGGGGNANDGGTGYYMPENCPVLPLGVQGKTCYYFDALRQLQEVSWKDHSLNIIKGMFGDQNHLLEAFWPRKKKIVTKNEHGDLEETWIITGWKPEQAADALMAECARRGVWAPQEKVRGIGAWRGEQGELIYHTGKAIFVSAPQGGDAAQYRWEKPGPLGEHLYPTGTAIMKPSMKRVPPGGAVTPRGEALNPGDAILRDLATWTLARGEIDAHLMLGLLASQRIGGALKARPAAWITGSAGSGKTEFMSIAAHTFGEAGLLKLENATEAAVRQSLKYSSLPVLLDENGDGGDKANPERVRAMVALMRIAVYGGRFGRGGGDHNGVTFIARSSFMSASILMPSLDPQDLSRMLIVELGKLRPGQVPPDISQDRWRRIGQALLNRMAQQWHRFDDTLEAYRQLLMKPIDQGGGGHDSRAADIFGTLLACADLVLHDAVPHADDEAFTVWGERLRADQWAEVAGGQSDQEQCWQHLVFSPLELIRQGGRKLVSEWIERAAGRKPEDRETPFTEGEQKEAQQALQSFGMRVIWNKELARLYGGKPPQDAQVPYLAVANKHPGLLQIFKDKRWGDGVWPQALKRLPGALVPPKPLWLSGGEADAMAGGSVRVTLVPIYASKQDEPAPAQGDLSSLPAQPDRPAAPGSDDDFDELPF